MDRFRARVLRTIREHHLTEDGDRAAVAVSGGADSVALLWVLRDLERSGDLRAAVAGLIHVNHHLRGEESARDEAFCLALAARLDLPIEIAHVDVAARARDERRSIEAVARDARYQFFTDAAPRLGATIVATGHTLDDQAETVLLRLLRGAGTRGLGGVRPRRGMFVRPLLRSRRADVREFLAARGEPFCEDSTNAGLTVPRNRVRHRLLPVIQEIAPGGIEALARFARLVADDEAYFERTVSEVAPSVVLNKDGGVQLNIDALGHLSRAMARRMVRRALEQVRPGAVFSLRHVEAALDLAKSGDHLDLPGVAIDRRGLTLCLSASDGGGRSSGGRIRRVELPVPGRAAVPEANVSVTASVYEEVPAGAMAGGDVAVVQASAIALPLAIRGRQPGDRLRPFGSIGHRKLQDVFVDRKVPREDRDAVPIVVDAAGRIVWVAGLTIDEACRVTAPSAGVVVLKVHR